MIQVWLIDENGFYQNESKFVDTATQGMTTIPLTVGYIKPQLVNDVWVEGATAEEITEWNKENKIDICPAKQPKTLDEMEKENEQLWETVQFLLKNGGFIPKEASNE